MKIDDTSILSFDVVRVFELHISFENIGSVNNHVFSCVREQPAKIADLCPRSPCERKLPLSIFFFFLRWAKKPENQESCGCEEEDLIVAPTQVASNGQ